MTRLDIPFRPDSRLILKVVNVRIHLQSRYTISQLITDFIALRAVFGTFKGCSMSGLIFLPFYHLRCLVWLTLTQKYHSRAIKTKSHKMSKFTSVDFSTTLERNTVEKPVGFLVSTLNNSNNNN